VIEKTTTQNETKAKKPFLSAKLGQFETMSKRISHARTYSSDKIADDVIELIKLDKFHFFLTVFFSVEQERKKTYGVVTNEDGTPAVTPGTSTSIQ
jgi:hypothetical protein